MTVWGFIHGCRVNIGEAQQLGWKVDRMDDSLQMTHANFPKHVVGFDLGSGSDADVVTRSLREAQLQLINYYDPSGC